MHDSRLEDRIKNFKTTNSNICKRREEFSLSLRRDKLFNQIMEKRLNKQKESAHSMEIDPEKLNLPQVMLDSYNQASTEDKFDLIVKWILEDETTDSSHTSNDIKKFAIHKLKLFTDDLNLDETSQDLELDKNLIEVLLYDLFSSREISIKLEISQIFLNLSYNSKNITESLLDLDYLNNFLELSYSNNFSLVENILLLFGNIIEDNKSRVELIINKIPIIYRLKELIQYDKYEGHENMRNYILWLIKCFVNKMQVDKYIMFVDFIPYFVKYFQLNYIANEENLFYLLQIISQLSLDEKFVSEKLIQHDIIKNIVDVLNRKNLVRDYIVISVRILGNLMCHSDQVIDVLFESKILLIFEKLINTYRNSVNNEDNYILYEVIWAISNITAGTLNQVQTVMFSNLPRIILNLNKFKKINKILSESNSVFYAALCKGDNLVFLQIIKLDVIRLFCDAVNNSESVDLIEIGLNAILKLIEWSISEYNSYYQIKNELICYNTLNRLEKLTLHKNEKIAKKAMNILKAMDMLAIDENKMDYEGV